MPTDDGIFVLLDAQVEMTARVACIIRISRNTLKFIAELQRAKRASEAPLVRKIGKPSSRENLVMTSAYDQASERASE